jgi:dephospho-CoA kinase
MVIGLTGGIGCGKSTAARLFAEAGFGLIDCDAIVRELLASDPAVAAEVADRFGMGVLLPAGGVDRRQLGARVFAVPEELEALEAILHPRVVAEWQRRVAADPAGPWLVEVPLLFEKGLEKYVDFTVCITCSPAVQLRRLADRGMAPLDAQQRIARQQPLARKEQLADFVLLNDGSLQFLQSQVSRLLQSIPSPA